MVATNKKIAKAKDILDNKRKQLKTFAQIITRNFAKALEEAEEVSNVVPIGTCRSFFKQVVFHSYS